MREQVTQPRTRRIAEGTAFVVVWIAIGLIFDLGDSVNRQSIYLLIGIPLTIVFQLYVRKRPLNELWVRNGPKVESRTVLVPLVIVLLIVPFYLLVRDIDEGPGVVFYDLALLVGAVGVGYAAKHFTDITWRDLAQCMLTAGLIGTLGALDLYEHVSTAHPFASPFDAPGRFRGRGGVVPGRARLAHPPSGREPRSPVGGVRLAALELVAPADHGEPGGREESADAADLHGAHGYLVVDLLETLGQPRRPRRHPCVQRLGPQHPRRRSVAAPHPTDPRGGPKAAPRRIRFAGSGLRGGPVGLPVPVQRVLGLDEPDDPADERQ
jgi:hypothetical protein